MISHPAKFSDAFIPVFARLLSGRSAILDPMAGTGKIALIKKHGFSGKITCNELEPEWKNDGYPVDEWHFTDASKMDWARDNEFDGICTSPTYGNRMADHHDARDGSKRYSYTHCLGRKLADGNTGKMQWGDEYRMKHLDIFHECWRVLSKNGIFVVNVSNHIRNGNEIDVVGWMKDIISLIGFDLINETKVPTPRMRNGENSRLRVGNESILVFTK